MTDTAARSLSGAGVGEPSEETHGREHPRRLFMSGPARPRLIRLLLLKSFGEFILVAALATLLLVDLRAPAEGEVEVIDGQTVKGWIKGTGHDDEVEVQLFIDGRFASSVTARRDESWTDTPHATADGRLNFALQLNHLSEGEHEARAYMLTGSQGGIRRTLTLLGQPVRFGSDANVVE